jgi:hypothetical protein
VPLRYRPGFDIGTLLSPPAPHPPPPPPSAAAAAATAAAAAATMRLNVYLNRNHGFVDLLTIVAFFRMLFWFE